MSKLTETVDATAFAEAGKQVPQSRVGRMAQGLIGSEILKIAAEIRALQKQGQTICNLTVGDFDPKQFAIPERLRQGIVAAYGRGETNYPPSDGMPALREAVQRFYERELGIKYPVASVLIASGARPIIHATYTATCDPGDVVIYPLPSWNNNHYVHMVGAQPRTLTCAREARFLPTRQQVLAALPGARLLCINSPLNPTGTAIDPEELRSICVAVVRENQARKQRGERPLFLLYDHIYWMLCVGDTVHATPTALVPEMAEYTVYVDGISKAFAATGVRVGWAVGPVDVIERMSAIVGHIGAWAPRAEQVATAQLLNDTPAVDTFLAHMNREVFERLDILANGVRRLAAAGHPVEAVAPAGAIYLSVRVGIAGRTTSDGKLLATDEDIRGFLLKHAGLAVVPFQAFGVKKDSGWFRASIGAVSKRELEQGLLRLEKALASLRA